MNVSRWVRSPSDRRADWSKPDNQSYLATLHFFAHNDLFLACSQRTGRIKNWPNRGDSALLENIGRIGAGSAPSSWVVSNTWNESIKLQSWLNPDNPVITRWLVDNAIYWIPHAEDWFTNLAITDPPGLEKGAINRLIMGNAEGNGRKCAVELPLTVTVFHQYGVKIDELLFKGDLLLVGPTRDWKFGQYKLSAVVIADDDKRWLPRLRKDTRDGKATYTRSQKMAWREGEEWQQQLDSTNDTGPALSEPAKRAVYATRWTLITQDEH